MYKRQNDETGYFWWFFLCERCRENPYGHHEDALAPIFLRRKKIVDLYVVDKRGRRMRNEIQRPVLCEEASWFQLFGSPPRDSHGCGNYWSPPNSPSLAPIPAPLIGMFLEFLLFRDGEPLGEPDADTDTDTVARDRFLARS